MSTRRMYTLTLCCQVRSVRQSGCSPTMHLRCPSLAAEQWSTTQSVKVWRNSVRHRERAWASWWRYTHPSFTYTTIQPSSSLKSLGVTLDKQLSFDQHIVDVCKACYFHIRALRHVRELQKVASCLMMPDDVAATVVCSVISTRLDYCNPLFTWISAANFANLQRVQNTLARVLQRRSKHDHITPALIQLHWLPIQQRVTYKLATLTFKTLSSD